jgi:hypothetical protein
MFGISFFLYYVTSLRPRAVQNMRCSLLDGTQVTTRYHLLPSGRVDGHELPKGIHRKFTEL